MAGAIRDAAGDSLRRPEWTQALDPVGPRVPEDNDRPSWVPEGAGDHFTTRVMKGVEAGINPAARKGRFRRKALGDEELVQGIREGRRGMLARGLTLVESNAMTHFDQAQRLIEALLPETGRSIRVGITGIPGVGKSTFIEALGTWLCDQGKKVAVLAVDPSSSVSGGSILGDKTRMEKLSRHENAFIRPSPSGGALGGVARKSRESILLCEAAGYEVILVETVGVGQSETLVRSMTDFFLLLMLAGAGDELQGLKKGIMELCDAIVVNKADGDNRPRANAARADYARVLHYLHPATPGWKPKALSASAVTHEGIPEVWQVIEQFGVEMAESGVFDQRRHDQARDWLHSILEEAARKFFFEDAAVREQLPEAARAVAAGDASVAAVARDLIEKYRESRRGTTEA